MLALLAALVGCAGPDAPPTLRLHPLGLHVQSPVPILAVAVQDPSGVPLVRQQPPAPVHELELRLRLTEQGTYPVQVWTTEGSHPLSLTLDRAPDPMVVQVAAPVGQGEVGVSDGDRVPLRLVGNQSAQVAVILTAVDAGAAVVRIGAQETRRDRLGAGERMVAMAEVAQQTEVEIVLGAAQWRFVLAPQRTSIEQARAVLTLGEPVFPAEVDGRPDLAREVGRVTLPAGWWAQVLRRTGLGFRPRDPNSPWSYTGVQVANAEDEALNVVVRMRVLDADGQPAAAFMPRMRGGEVRDGAVTALLRVPAGATATAALPFFVDEALLSSHQASTTQWERVVDLTPIGSSTPLVEVRSPLAVKRGSTPLSIALLVALLGAVGGWVLIGTKAPGWLARSPTSTITTIALFGALNFLASALGRLMSLGVATVLGPFSTLLSNLVDDALRYTLLATLVTLLPRPGVVTLAALTHWLLTGLALGDLGPTDVLFIGNKVLWLELMLWITGITRLPDWRESSAFRRWVRLGLGFGVASAITTLLSFALHMVLYRLFFADWYVALLVLGPGFLYVWLACLIAVPFAHSLRRVQR